MLYIALAAAVLGIVAVHFRRRDPVYERAVADAERQQQVQDEARARRELRELGIKLVGGVIVAALVWGWLGFPTSSKAVGEAFAQRLGLKGTAHAGVQ